MHGSNENCQETNNKAVKLVTVHGTGAGDVTSSGDKWWQLGSVFMDELQQRLELDSEQVEIVPFQWQNGPNSEFKRREAGTALADQLYKYDAAQQDYYLIGHSHGGSVIYNALLKSVADDTPFERLKLWCTVGTPFLDYRPNTFLFQRLRSLGLTICTTGIVLFILGVWITSLAFFGSTLDDAVIDMGYAMMLYGVINYTALWLYEYRKKSWFTLKQKKQASEHYAKQWCGLWHKEDEAISALSNVRSINAPIIPANFLYPIVSSLQFISVILVGLYFAWDIAFSDSKAILGIAQSFLEDMEDGVGFGFFTYMMTVMIFVFCIPTIWLFTKILSLLAGVVGRPLATLLNKIVWSSIKKRAWGDDLLKEDVYSIGSHPPLFLHQWDFLSETVAAPLRKHSEKNAIKTLHKVRVVLGMSEQSSGSADIRSELSESLNWQELIHTSYFDVPEFIDLLVSNLRSAGLRTSPEANV